MTIEEVKDILQELTCWINEQLDMQGEGTNLTYYQADKFSELFEQMKQIEKVFPETPLKRTNSVVYRCPECHSFITTGFDQDFVAVCPNCSKALDWSGIR